MENSKGARDTLAKSSRETDVSVQADFSLAEGYAPRTVSPDKRRRRSASPPEPKKVLEWWKEKGSMFQRAEEIVTGEQNNGSKPTKQRAMEIIDDGRIRSNFVSLSG